VVIIKERIVLLIIKALNGDRNNQIQFIQSINNVILDKHHSQELNKSIH